MSGTSSRDFLFSYTLQPVAGQPGEYTIVANTGLHLTRITDTSTGAGDDTHVLGDVANDSFTAGTTAETYQGYGVALFSNGQVTAAGPIGLNGTTLTLYSEQNIAAGTLIQLEADVPGFANEFDLATASPTFCFMAGTLIRTPDGEVAVETLKAGDLVLTSDGAAQPVRWLGRQTVATRFMDKHRVGPIRVKAGALAEGLPARDLVLSPDHAVLIDGVLAHAGALVNGASVVRETALPDSFTYYHVELADHSLVLAEGVPAETFIDNVDRMAFDNWDEHQALFPVAAPLAEMELPRAKSFRQVPSATRQRLAARAEALFGTEAVQAA